MLSDADIRGKVVYDPSAGSGNIISYAWEHGCRDAIASEINHDFRKILQSKCRIIGSDFMDVRAEDISHVDFIIMNPPFSADEKHIIHAYEIAPEGCSIISLCNWNTLENRYSYSRSKLNELITKYGSKVNIENVFSDADRSTDVQIGLVNLYKPKTGKETEFDGYFDLSEEYEQQQNGIMEYSEIRSIVNRYVAAVKLFDSVMEANKEIEALIDPINIGVFSFGAFMSDRDKRGDKIPINRETFKKELQKSAWKTIFNKLNMWKYVTQKVIAIINKQIEKQVAVPFTMRNIYKMIEVIVGTKENTMNMVLTEAFDKICSFSHENSEAGEKWKTNSSYKVNIKFIKNYITEISWSGQMSLRCSSADDMDDIYKALCYLTGTDYNDLIPFRNYIQYRYKLKSFPTGKLLTGYNYYSNSLQEIKDKQKSLHDNGKETIIVDSGPLEFGKWIETDFFLFRGYKKGTGHFMFKDERVWMQFNRKVAEIRGWRLPSKTDTKKKGTERSKSEGVEIY
jgi:hypothetical protein